MKIITNATTYSTERLQELVDSCVAVTCAAWQSNVWLHSIKNMVVQTAYTARIPRVLWRLIHIPRRATNITNIHRLLIPRTDVSERQLVFRILQMLHASINASDWRHWTITQNDYLPFINSHTGRLIDQEIDFVTDVQRAIARKQRLVAVRHKTLANARLRLKQATTRAKRATTLLTKWERTVARLERAHAKTEREGQ